MPCSFVAYIDESGDEGFAFGSGSSEWFVLSAAVTLKAEDLNTVKLVDRVRQRLGRPEHKPLHFRDLRHEHRLPFIAEISRAPLRVVTLLVHKPSLPKPEELQQGSLLYFKAVHELLERVGMLCRGGRPRTGDGTADVVFSNRSGMSYEALIESMRTDRFEGAPIRHDQIYSHSAGRRTGLQIADAVASGFFKAVEPTQYGYTEDRYARMLKAVLYRKEGVYQGYGLNLWPPLGERLLTADRLSWVREILEEEKD
jgi:hypothetical protein